MNPLLKHVPQGKVHAEKIRQAIIKMVTEVYRVDVRPVPYHEKTSTRLGDEWGYSGGSSALYNSIMLEKATSGIVIRSGWHDSDREWIGERVVTALPITEEDAAWIANVANGLDWQPHS